MKKILCIAALAPLLLSCLRTPETFSTEKEQRSPYMTSVTASLSAAPREGEAKSVCSSDVEAFVEAFVFAFPASGAPPLTKHVTDTDVFSWTLPRDEELDIWAVANPPDALTRARLEELLDAPDLTKQDLLDLPPFRCTGSGQLQDLEVQGRNLPMSGTVQVCFNGPRAQLTIPLKRLFAKYAIKLNFSRFSGTGWTIDAASLQCRNCNGSVPYFYNGAGAGYAAAAEDLVPVGDRDAEEDITLLNTVNADGTSIASVFFYMPENCQGSILKADGEPAQSWRTVHQELGERVASCSYLAVNVVASTPGVPERRFTYRIYPGAESTMNRNFDVVRNSFCSLTVTLAPDSETDFFRWTASQPLVAEPGETLSIPFASTLDAPVFGTSSEDLAWVDVLAGQARFTVSAGATDGTVYAVGGDADGMVRDRIAVTIADRLKVAASIPGGTVFYEPFRLSLQPSRGVWPEALTPSLLSVHSSAPAGREAIEILSGPFQDASGWYFKARCTGPRSAADRGETLLVKDGGGETVGMLEIPDVMEQFGVPLLSFDGPSMTEDGSFVLPVDGADCARIELQAESLDGEELSLPTQYISLVSSDGAVDDFYVEYGSGTLDVYLPGWEGIPGLQDFDPDHVSAEPYLQRVSNALQLRSKTGYVFHSEAITFLIPNPFTGYDGTLPYAQIVSGRKVDIPSGWTLQAGSPRKMVWRFRRNPSRPASTLWPVLLSDVGYVDAGTKYTASSDGYDTVQIPLDNKTYGRIAFGLTVENVLSGESASAWAAVVDVVRELEISAALRIHQRHYPLMNPNSDEARIKVSAQFDRITALDPIVNMDFLRMTATPATPVHPTKAEAESLGPFWVNYASTLGAHPYFGVTTRYVVPSDDALHYEILWNPGSTAGYFNYRVVTLWNVPQFDFDVEGFREKHPDTFPQMHVVPASGDMCRYLHVDDYTRIVFYWERWKSSYTDTGKGWYLCDNESISPRYASAYYMALAANDPYYGRCFFGYPGQSGTDVDPVYGGDPFFIQSNNNTFETILDY